MSELIDEVDKIKGNTKTLILSNGANIYKQDIQQTLSKIDIVKLSLDCVSYNCFKKLDRIDSSVDCSKIVEGMIEFREIHKKQLIIEVLFVKTLNDSDKEIDLIYKALKRVKANRIDIGTIDRPPAYDVQPLEYEKLLEIANAFKSLPVVVTHKNTIVNKQSYLDDEIVTLLKRRPLTKSDISNIFDDKSVDRLNVLINDNKVMAVDNNGVMFYKIKSH